MQPPAPQPPPPVLSQQVGSCEPALAADQTPPPPLLDSTPPPPAMPESQNEALHQPRIQQYSNVSGQHYSATTDLTYTQTGGQYGHGMGQAERTKTNTSALPPVPGEGQSAGQGQANKQMGQQDVPSSHQQGLLGEYPGAHKQPPLLLGPASGGTLQGRREEPEKPQQAEKGRAGERTRKRQSRWGQPPGEHGLSQPVLVTTNATLTHSSCEG